MKKFDEKDLVFLGWVFIIVLIVCFTFGFYYVFNSLFKIDNHQKAEVYELYALKINSTVSGNFFLGCGSFDNVTHYYFNYIATDGAIIFCRIPATQCRIYPINKDKTPKVLSVNGSFDIKYIQSTDVFMFSVPKDAIYRDINLKLP